MGLNDGRTEEDLMEAFYRGDNPAFDEIDNRHRERLARRSSYRLPPSLPPQARRAAAEEYAQATLVRARDTKDRPGSRWRRDKGRVRPWLDRILVSVMSDGHRKAWRREAHERTATDLEPAHLPREAPGILDAAAARDAPPNRQVEREEVKRRLRECLDDLPEHLRSLVLDRYWEDMSQTEIAVATGQSNPTITRRLQEARRQLGECLRRKGIDVVE